MLHNALTFVCCLFLLACGRVPAPEPRTVPVVGAVDGKHEAAAGVSGRFNIPHSPYFPAIDVYGASPTATLVKLNGFRTYQQTSEISCGPACAVMVLDWFGVPAVSEDTLAREMDIRPPGNPRPDGSYGAETAAMANAFRSRGLAVTSSLETRGQDGRSFATSADFVRFVDKALKTGQAIMVENVTWGGHWMVLVGYDGMGTPDLLDDVLIFADPYDTSDHHQDGLAIRSLLPFFAEWFDAGVLPLDQRTQAYVLVGPAAPPRAR